MAPRHAADVETTLFAAAIVATMVPLQQSLHLESMPQNKVYLSRVRDD
jgi:hypothetical protein